jgi:serralysin
MAERDQAVAAAAEQHIRLVRRRAVQCFVARAGDQLLVTGGGRDVLVAGAGNETLDGSAATKPNVLFGGSGNSLIALGHRADTVVGGSGRSTVTAGRGNAAMWVGGGADTFVFNAGQTGGSDLIGGFRPGVDHLVLSGYARPAGIVAGNGQSLVQLSDGTQITILGVSTSNIASLS